jgi:hypothetical protein
MLETDSTLNLEQLFKITPKLKKNLWLKLKSNKPHIYTRSMTNKTTPSLVLDINTTTITMNNYMATIIHRISAKTIVKLKNLRKILKTRCILRLTITIDPIKYESMIP